MVVPKSYLYRLFRKKPVTNDSDIPPIPPPFGEPPKQPPESQEQPYQQPPPVEESYAQQDTVIERMKISESYKEEALKHIKSLVHGNQCDPETVELKAFEGEILHFQAENMLTLLSKMTNKRVPGRVQSGQKVDGEIGAKEAMTRAYLTLAKDKDMEKRIRDTVLNRSDKGFGVDGTIIPLPFWKKEFIVMEPCQTCKTNGTVTCLPCGGKGVSPCPRCHGSSQTHCSHCNGAQMVMGQNNRKIQCPMCHGRGKIGCTGCNASGRIQCKTCSSKGVTTCPNCQGNAWTSVIHKIEIEARTAFDYPRDKLPEKVVALIERYGDKFKEYAEIKIAQDQESVVNKDDEEKARQQEIADQRKDIRFPILYEVILPYGHIEYDIKGKTYYTFLFGNKAKLEHVSPFLDDLIKNGIRKLHDAAELRGDVYENLKMAGEYRTVKEGIAFTASGSMKKAKEKLKKANNLGLSDHAIKEIITLSDRALKNITKKPRMVGLGISALLNAVLLGAYFLTPIRDMIVGHIPNIAVQGLIDSIIFLAFMYIGVMAIQMTAESAIKKTMAMLLPGGLKTAPPKLGQVAYWNIATCSAIFAGILFATPYAGVQPPAWFQNIMGLIM